MTKQVWSAVSVSNDTYIHISDRLDVSAGLANETTLLKNPQESDVVRIFVAGAFQASAPVNIDLTPDGVSEANLASVSAGNAPFTSAYSIPTGFKIHIGMLSANGAQSVDVFIG